MRDMMPIVTDHQIAGVLMVTRSRVGLCLQDEKLKMEGYRQHGVLIVRSMQHCNNSLRNLHAFTPIIFGWTNDGVLLPLAASSEQVCCRNMSIVRGPISDICSHVGFGGKSRPERILLLLNYLYATGCLKKKLSLVVRNEALTLSCAF